MLNLFQCPADTVLGNIPNQECALVPGQVNYLAFHLRSGGAAFATLADIASKTKWNTLLAADDNTRIVIVPVTTFAAPGGEMLSTGGNDNTTPDGTPKQRGVGFVTATFMIEGAQPEYMEALLNLVQHSRGLSGRSNLEVYMLTSENKIRSSKDFKGIPVKGLIFGDENVDGEFRAESKYPGQFYLKPHWSIGTTFSQAAFEVDELVNVEVEEGGA